MAQLISGKEISAAIRAELKEETARLKEQGVVPGLAVVLVGMTRQARYMCATKSAPVRSSAIILRNIRCLPTPRRSSFWNW